MSSFPAKRKATDWGSFFTLEIEISKNLISKRTGGSFWDCVDVLNSFGLLTDHDLYLQRLEECQGYLEPYDYGPGNPSGVHPDLDFCEQWQPYLEDCLSGGMLYRQTIDDWAELLWKNEAAFNCLVQNDNGCSAGNELMPDYTEYINGVSALPCLTEQEKCNFITNPDPTGIVLIEELQPEIGFDNGELCWLMDEDNRSLISKIQEFKESYPNNTNTKDYIKYMVYSLRLEPNVEFDDLVFAFEWENLLDNPNSIPTEEDIQEVHNGIEILETYVPVQPPVGVYIGGVPPRGNTEDLEFGTNGSTDGIDENMVELSNQGDDNGLFQEMTELFHFTSTGTLEVIGDQFIDHFRNYSTAPPSTYHNPSLSNVIMNTKVIKNFIKKFGKRLNDELQASGGDISNVQINIPLEDRPIFNSNWHKANGHTILIHDNEETTVTKMDTYELDSVTGEWTCHFFIEITDHFGLDRRDVLNNQGRWNVGEGFAAWWLL